MSTVSCDNEMNKMTLKERVAFLHLLFGDLRFTFFFSRIFYLTIFQ